MRLSKIKLEGFKSFVDPTTIHFPSNRVGIIGPNGCGKSNVIDAVRWVMGEISAKNLRGGAMIDVIFNGSATRKPANSASIELVFDEADLPMYPDYKEIGVKREISRNGQSNYFLNGVKCRRKDITDLFLGTGLGPRSYAIIEQGMISRMIEAKPEELRIFVEEAAGIAKYKDRRKETEQRMQQTRDNLARLDEVRFELQKQLEKLQRQAKEAERYQQLKNTEQLLKAQLFAMRWYAQENLVQEKQVLIETHAEQLQNNLIQLHTLESDYKQYKEQRGLSQNSLEEVQEHYYKIERELDRLQQSIAHNAERHEQLQWDIEQAHTEIQNVQRQMREDQQHIEMLEEELFDNEQQLSEAHIVEEETEQNSRDADFNVQQWQVQWDEFNQRAAEPTKRAEVEKTQLQHLEQRLTQNQQRLIKNEEQSRQLDTHHADTELKQLELALTDIVSQLQQAEQQLMQLQTEELKWREETQHSGQQLHELNTQVQRMTGLLASLEALQDAALGKGNSDLEAWLHVHELKQVKRVAHTLQVETGWEKAIEVVLGERLQAFCVTDLNSLQTGLERPPQGKLALVETQAVAQMPQNKMQGILLATKVKNPEIQTLLGQVYIAESVTQALQLRTQLTAESSFITQEGIWMGCNWLYSQQAMDEQASVIAREKQIQQLAVQLEKTDKAVLNCNEQLETKRRLLRETELQRDSTQKQVNTIRHQLSQLQSQQGGKSARLENMRLQILRLQEEREELLLALTDDEQMMDETRAQLHASLQSMSDLADERAELSQQRAELQEIALQARQAWQLAKEQRHHLEVKVNSAKTDMNRLQQGLERLEERLEQAHIELEDLQSTLQKQIDPMGTLHTELEQWQQQRSINELALNQAKQTAQNIEQHLTQCEEQRQFLENKTQELRLVLEQAKLEMRNAEERRKDFAEQLMQIRLPIPDSERTFNPAQLLNVVSSDNASNNAEENHEEKPLPETTYSPTPIQVLSELPEHADEPSWLAQIEATQRKLNKIGSVNLAALEEYTQESQRKQYLDEQAADLNNGLTLLENAIKTIDKETRQRFKTTLESINATLQTMFPRLFGGGEAKLELQGEDLLTAGVAIMARPPGKKNSSIHLLSGGEKALTAIALVFSIFELNPAPFCMLDEVDAPLDDVNVGRFSALVNLMAERVQFIFITHNKITMEIADQLVGVTQHELGVSRPVSVDINKAMDMINA